MHYASADYLESFDTGIYGDPVFDDDFNDTAFLGKLVKSVGKAVGGAVSSVAKGVANVATGAANVVATPAKMAVAAVKGQNVLKAGANSLSSAAKSVQKGIGALTNNPLWNIAQTGLSFIPGVGTAVSAGMASAAALGRGESVKNAALAAVRGAIPGGPVAQAAFDVGLGVVRGERLDNAALGAVRKQIPGGPAAQAAFDAAVMVAKGQHLDQVAVEMARRAMPASSRAVFDRAIQAGRAHALRTTNHPYPQIGARPAVVANALHKIPALRALPVAKLASTLKQPQQVAKTGLAAFVSRFGGDTGSFDVRDVAEWDSADTAAARFGARIPAGVHLPPGLERLHGLVTHQPRPRMSRANLARLGRVGGPAVARALRLSSDTGADPDGPPFPAPSKFPNGYPGDTYTVISGDNPSKISQTITGVQSRWKELLAANPTKKHPDPAFGMRLMPGDKLVVPVNWRASAAPAPPPPAPLPLPLPPVPGVPASIDPEDFELPPAGDKGPPFPAPSKFPNGYPGDTYTVVSGDNPSKIAQSITGVQSRWKELLAANPTKAHPDPAFGMRLMPGDRLVVPQHWRAMSAKPPVVVPELPIPTVPEVPEIPVPTIPTIPGMPEFPMPTIPTIPGMPEIPVPTIPTIPGMPEIPVPNIPTIPGMPEIPVPNIPAAPELPEMPDIPTAPARLDDGRAQVMQTQGLLAVFGKQQGAQTEVGRMDYGSQPSDLSGDWGDRSTRAMQAFQAWANANGYGPIPTTGQPDSISHASLLTVVSNARMPGQEQPPPAHQQPKKNDNGLAIIAGGFALGKAMGWF